MTDRHDKRLARKIATVAEDGQRRATELDRKLTELESDVSRTREVVAENWNAIRDARKEMEGVRLDVERLMSEVVSGFESLNRSVETMEQRSQDATRDIVAGIRSSEETARAGLHSLSTGFAMADALKVVVEADEIELEMREALQELDGSRQAAERSIEERRLTYDQAAASGYDELDQQLGSLGAHIIDLQDSLQQTLTELRMPEHESRRLENELLRVQAAALAHRARTLTAPLGELRQDALSRLVSLRESLETFLDSQTIEELAADAEDGMVLPALGVPIIAVAAPESDYNERGRRMDVYGPGCEVDDCADGPRPAPVPTELAQRLGRMCAGLSTSAADAAPLTDDALARLKQDVSRLADTGVLTSEDALMVAAHLDSHPLYRLES
jgi:archaellum component FlaC